MQHPDADRLALAALPAEDGDPELERHLADCADCRAEVESLRRTVELATADRTEITAPPSRVWDAIAAELDVDVQPQVPRQQSSGPVRSASSGPGSARPRSDRPAGRPGSGRPDRRWTWRSTAIAAVAAVIGLAAGLGIGLGLPSASPAPVPMAQLQPIGPADPNAVGTVDSVRRDGADDLVVNVDGVTDTVGGDYLEVWLIDPAGTRLVSLGALARTGPDAGAYSGEFTVPAGLPMAEFGLVDVSAERWDGNPGHSGVSLLRGPVT